MENKKNKPMIKLLFVIILLSFQLTAFGEETEEHRLEDDWGQQWFGGDFSDLDCGEVVIHISFSEEARKVFGTCEELVNVLIRSEGTWWTYGERKRYSDIVPVEFDKTVGYQVRKKLPYGKYCIAELAYTGKVNSDYHPDYIFQFPVYFEISKEEPEIPVFLEFKKPEVIEERKDHFVDKTDNYYDKLYAEAKEKGTDPHGKVQFHAELGNPDRGYFVAVELGEINRKISHLVTDSYYFGKTNNYTYTANLYPGMYRIHRAYYIDDEGTVLAENKSVRNYEFEVLPQCDPVQINLSVSGNPEEISADVGPEKSEETLSKTMEEESAEGFTEIEPGEWTITSKKQGHPQYKKQNQGLVILYRMVAFVVLAGLLGGGAYFWMKNKD